MNHSTRKKRSALLAFLIYTLVEVCLLPPAHASPDSKAQIPPESPASLSLAPIELTYIDYQTNTFAAFKDGDTSRLPTTMGIVLWLGGRKVLVPTRKILSLEDMYLLRDPRDPLFLEAVEKLPRGGFGRLLRYRGFVENGNWVDLEFVYQDKENGLIILDRESGQFYQTLMREKRQVPDTFFPWGDSQVREKSAALFQGSSSKFLMVSAVVKKWMSPRTLWLRNQFEELSGQEIWSQHLVRGPPAEGITP